MYLPTTAKAAFPTRLFRPFQTPGGNEMRLEVQCYVLSVVQMSSALSYLSRYLLLLMLLRLGTRMLSYFGVCCPLSGPSVLYGSVLNIHLSIVLLQQSRHLQPKTKAQDVSANGSAIGMDDLLAVDLLPLHPDTCRWAEGPDTLEMLDDLVVRRIG